MKPLSGATPRRAAPTVFTAFAAVLLIAGPASAGFRYVPPGQGMQAAATSQPMALQPSVMPAPVAMRGGSVQGFASQVPLPVALRQVLPRGIAFSIADNVDTATRVTWQGGQSWQQTVEAMLAPAGLRAVYTSNKVLVTRDALAPVALPAAAPANLPPVHLTPPPERFATTEIGNAEPLAPLPVAAPEPEPVAYAAPEQPMASAPIYAQPASAPEPMPVQPVNIQPAPMMEPMAEPAPQIVSQPVPAPQPYIASSTGPASSLMPPGSSGGNATIGAVRDAPPVSAVNTMAPLPEAAVNSATAVPGTELGGLSPIVTQPAQTSVAPGDVSETAPVATTMAALDATPAVVAAPWEARSGQTLHETLADWSKRAGIELNWLSEYDYPIQASLTFSGSFEEAVRTLLGGFANAAPQPVGRLHRNEQLGQQALIIEMRGNAYDD